MKKWLITWVLMFAPIYAGATSLAIDNPVISQGQAIVASGQNSQYTFAFEQIKSGFVTLKLDAFLTGSEDTVMDITVTTYLQDWSLTVLDQAQGVSTLLIDTTNSNLHQLSIAMLAGNVYQFIFTGTTPLTHFSVEIAEVSEIPLPAAVWLFGSVLLGGLAIRRRLSGVESKC